MVTTGWDAVVRAAVRCGHIAALRAMPDGALSADGMASATLATALARGISFTRLVYACPGSPHFSRLEGLPDVQDVLKMPLPDGVLAALEFGALAWRELGGSDAACDLKEILPVPHGDPVVALRIGADRVAEFEKTGPTIPPLGEDANRVWYVEIESPQNGMPRALSHFRTVNRDGDTIGSRLCAVWTDGPDASYDRPLTIGLSWNYQTDIADGGVIRWPLLEPEEWVRPPDPAPIIAAKQDILLSHAVPVLLNRAIAAWLQARSTNGKTLSGGFDRRRGQMRLLKPRKPRPPRHADGREIARRLRHRSLIETVVCPAGIDSLLRGDMPEPRTGLDSVLLAAVKASDATPLPRKVGPAPRSRLWWLRVEQGVVFWYAVTCGLEFADLCDGGFQVGGNAMEKVLSQPVPLALRCVGELVWKTLTQTGRAELVKMNDPGSVHGLRVPGRLWNAITEAGPHPELADIFEDRRWWYVEIENPKAGEPRALALWPDYTEDGQRIETGLAIWTEGRHASPECPLIAAWKLQPGDDAQAIGWAQLSRVPSATGIAGEEPDPEIHKDASDLVAGTIVGPDCPRVRVCAAITEYLARGRRAEPMDLMPFFRAEDGASRTSAGSATIRDGPDDFSIFALVRAPDPVVANPAEPATRGGTGSGQRGPLEEQQYVAAHYKRQAFGPGRALRRVVCIEGYWRGPEPDGRHVVLERMAAQVAG